MWTCQQLNENSSVWISVISPLTALVKLPMVSTFPLNGGTVSNVTIDGHVYCKNTELSSKLLYADEVGDYKVVDPQPIWSDVDEGNHGCDYGETNKKYTTTVTRTISALRGKRVTFKIRFNQTACNSSFTTTSSPVFFFAEPPDDNRTLIKGISASGSLSLVKGEERKLQCEVKGGVPLAVVIWNCLGGTVTNTSVEGIARSNITFTATDSQNGRFCTCSATHPVAVIAETSVQIHVTYAAIIKSMKITGNNFTVSENSKPKLTCNADGFPAPLVMLRHIRKDMVLAKTTGIVLYYEFPNARCEDTGQYRCEAYNNLNTLSSITKELYVLCSPRRIDKTESKIAFASGGTLNISTIYLAYPKPDFIWYFEKKESYNKSQLGNSEKELQINNTFEIENDAFRHGSLIIRNHLEEPDFGTYTIIATNEVDSSIDSFIVSAKAAEESYNILPAALAGGFGSAAFFIIVVIVVVYVLMRFKCLQWKGARTTELNGKSALTSRQYDGNDEDDMRINELYVYAGPNYVKPGSSTGAVGGPNDCTYSEVKKAKGQNKSPGKPDATYAIVQKKTNKNSDPSRTNAVVDMTKKTEKGRAKRKQKALKPTPQVYKNIESMEMENASGESLKSPKTSRKRNADGLIYLDLDLSEPQNNKSGFVIHGEENRTNYEEVNITKRAIQVLPDDENKNEI